MGIGILSFPFKNMHLKMPSANMAAVLSTWEDELIHEGLCKYHCLYLLLRNYHSAWWRHQMETFSASLAICAGNSPFAGEFPAQRPVTRSFDVFFDLRLNERLSKQSWGWWFETRSRPLWRHCNGNSLSVVCAKNTKYQIGCVKHILWTLALVYITHFINIEQSI